MAHRLLRFRLRHASHVGAAGILLAATLGGDALAQQVREQRQATLGPAAAVEVLKGDVLPPLVAPDPDFQVPDPPPPEPLPEIPAVPENILLTGAVAEVDSLPPPVTLPTPPPPAAPYSPPPTVSAVPTAPVATAGPSVEPALPPAAEEQFMAPEPVRRPLLRFIQEFFIGYRENFRAPPLGETIHRQFEPMVINGDAARMVLYQYDFAGGTQALNYRGTTQLARIAAMLPQNFFPIVIEPVPECPGLAEARRMVVLNELAHGCFPVPAERVVIGPSPAESLRGVEAMLIYSNLLAQTQRQGISTTGATNTTTGLSFGGSTGGGTTGGGTGGTTGGSFGSSGFSAGTTPQ